VLGAIATATSRVDLVTAVTCPFVRYHPAIVAQAAATVACLSGGRMTLGLGAGDQEGFLRFWRDTLAPRLH
jgi:alkanesulfonate monooxygenase SsuD/methylene tetrahydromethanopterin reductase-like flavin-dependent oxidoreductase (luciferase family)